MARVSPSGSASRRQARRNRAEAGTGGGAQLSQPSRRPAPGGMTPKQHLPVAGRGKRLPRLSTVLGISCAEIHPLLTARRYNQICKPTRKSAPKSQAALKRTSSRHASWATQVGRLLRPIRNRSSDAGKRAEIHPASPPTPVGQGAHNPGLIRRLMNQIIVLRATQATCTEVPKTNTIPTASMNYLGLCDAR